MVRCAMVATTVLAGGALLRGAPAVHDADADASAAAATDLTSTTIQADDRPRLRIGESLRFEGRLEDADRAGDDGARSDGFVIDCDAGAIEITVTATGFRPELRVRPASDVAGWPWGVEEEPEGAADSRVRRVLDARTPIQVAVRAAEAREGGSWIVELRLEAASPGDVRASRLQAAHDAAEEATAIYDEGRAAEAAVILERTLATRRALLGDEHPDTLTTINDYGYVLDALGRSLEAEPYAREALETRRRVLGDDHPDTLVSLDTSGRVLESLGRADEAEPLYREALASSRRVLGEDDPGTLRAINNYGSVLLAIGRNAEAEPHFREAFERCRRVLGEDHPDTLISMANHARVLELLGRIAELERVRRAMLEGSRARRGEEHPETLLLMVTHADALKALRRDAEAEAAYLAAMTAHRRALGDDHPHALEAIRRYALVVEAIGRPAAAEPYYREVLEARRRVLGDEHIDTLMSINDLGVLLHALGRASEAEPHFREALDVRRRTLGDAHPDTVSSINNYGSVLGALGRPAEAEPYYREALAIRRRTLGDDHPDTILSINNYGFVLEPIGRIDEAESYFREALQRSRRALGNDHERTLTLIGNFGGVLQSRGRIREAEPFVREALDGRRRVLGDRHPDTVGSLSHYGYVLLLLGRPAEGEPYVREAMDAHRRILGDAHPATLGSISSLAMILESTGRPREAAPLWLEYVAAAERIRDTAPGDERGRAALADELNLGWASLRAARLAVAVDGDAAAAFDLVERGRGRTLLDLIARSEESIVRVLRRQAPRLAGAYVRAVATETAARDGVRTLEAAADAAARRGDAPERERLDAEAVEARATLVRSTFAVFELIREHLRATAPMPAVAAQELLEPGTVLLSVGVNADAGVVVALSRTSAVGAAVDDGRLLSRKMRALRDAVASGREVDASAIIELRAMIVPPELRQLVDASDRLVILPSPELSSVPFELILPGTPITYASSASVHFDRRDAAAELVRGRDVTLVAAGDPDFSRLSGMVAAVDGPAGGDARALARTETLRSASRDQLRSYGGMLSPLPGTRAEVRTIQAVAAAAGAAVHELLGRDANVPALQELVRLEEPRYLHLATHGFPGTSERPYTASLALTAPATPSPGDTGFLTLDDLIQDWFGLLEETDLVVLSACDTAVGVARGDSDMALPWGFYFAGAPTVICSLWEVDDAATALLMGRLYENLLGGQTGDRTVWGRTTTAGASMSKADALDEAKAWLRGLTRGAARTALDAIGLTDQPLPRGLGLGASAGDAGGAGDGDAAAATHPYAHPRYWAAFTLRGSAD